MINRLGRYFLVITACLIANVAIAQTQNGQDAFSEVGLQALHGQAEDALINGDPHLTITITDRILAVQPDSFNALFLRALALSDLDEDGQAARVARQAYNAATNEPARLEASKLAGRAHFEAENYSRAEFWLRRATNHLQDLEDAQQVATLFQRTRRANPLTTQYDFSLAPTDNVNGGSDENEICLENGDGSCACFDINNSGECLDIFGVLFGLNEADLPLSGVVYTGSARLSYRLSMDRNQITTVSALFFGESVILSQDAKDLLASSDDAEVRAVEASDFSSFLSEFSFGQRQSTLSPLGPTYFSLHYGNFQQASTPLIRYQDLKFGQQILLDWGDAISLDFKVRAQQGLVSGIGDSKIYDTSGTYNAKFANGDTASLTLSRSDTVTEADSGSIEYMGQLAYAFDTSFLNARWSANAQIGTRSFGFLNLIDEDREDVFASLGLVATLEDYSYFGFSPNISFQATQTDSNFDLVDTTSIQLRFGIRSNL